MAKGEDLCGSPRLRCVHCLSTETPLWRSGPDGPKTLCNACGVRFKKGKLALFKDKDGNLTAVHSENSLPVVVPQATKKASKKNLHLRTQAGAQESKRVVRKTVNEPPIAAAVVKKPRARARRATAGQLPGRYASKSLPEDLTQWRSACGSPSTGPSSPAASPDERDDYRPGLLSSPTFLNLDEPSLYQFSEVDDENMVPDFAFLGLGSDCGSQTGRLLPMPADPSSTEQFSFAFAELGRDASLAIDLPERIGALRALVQEKQVSKFYDNCVQSLAKLWIQQRRPQAKSDRRPVEYLKEFIRALILQQDPTCVFSTLRDASGGIYGVTAEPQSPIMLPERALYIAATESLTGLMDNVQMVGFAEACLIELLAEDVQSAVTEQRGDNEGRKVAADKNQLTDTPTLSNDAISVKA